MQLVRRTENSAVFALGPVPVTREVRLAAAGCMKRTVEQCKFTGRCGKVNRRNQYLMVTVS